MDTNIKIVSIDFNTLLAFFKIPDINGELDSKSYSFESIHKPALLGMFGSLLGLKGVADKETVKNQDFPEYYKKLSKIEIGISILDKGNKQWNIENSAQGFYNKTKDKSGGSTLNIKREVIANPKYRIFLKLNLEHGIENELYQILKENYIGKFGDLYMGKKAFPVERTNFKEYNFEKISEYKGIISTLFQGRYETVIDRINGISNENKNTMLFLFEESSNSDIYEETISLPVELIKKDKTIIVRKKDKQVTEIRYKGVDSFVNTNKNVKLVSNNLYKLDNETIYLF